MSGTAYKYRRILRTYTTKIMPMQSVTDRRKFLSIERGHRKPRKEKKMDELLKTIRGYLASEKQGAFEHKIYFPQLVDEILENIKDHTTSPKLSINIRVRQDIPFYTDFLRISLALEHVLRNAVHFQDKNKAENIVDIDISVDPVEAIIEIVDNGEGIPREAQNRIFEPFVKISKASSGFGVGLYVVEKCLDDLGGYININSSYSIGTHCILKVPNLKGK